MSELATELNKTEWLNQYKGKKDLCKDQLDNKFIIEKKHSKIIIFPVKICFSLYILLSMNVKSPWASLCHLVGLFPLHALSTLCFYLPSPWACLFHLVVICFWPLILRHTNTKGIWYYYNIGLLKHLLNIFYKNVMEKTQIKFLVNPIFDMWEQEWYNSASVAKSQVTR